MRKLILISLFLFSFSLLYSQVERPKFKHKIVENYIQLTGEQTLSETESITIPFSKQGYTLYTYLNQNLLLQLFFQVAVLLIPQKI